jgi:hypothetical protein
MTPGGQQSFDDPTAIYAQLPPDQRANIAQEFIRQFQQSGDPIAQQFAGINPNNITPQQLGAIHQQARKNPGVLERVMRHPIAAAALGGFAAYEIDKHVRH